MAQRQDDVCRQSVGTGAAGVRRGEEEDQDMGGSLGLRDAVVGREFGFCDPALRGRGGFLLFRLRSASAASVGGVLAGSFCSSDWTAFWRSRSTWLRRSAGWP